MTVPIKLWFTYRRWRVDIKPFPYLFYKFLFWHHRKLFLLNFALCRHFLWNICGEIYILNFRHTFTKFKLLPSMMRLFDESIKECKHCLKIFWWTFRVGSYQFPEVSQTLRMLGFFWFFYKFPIVIINTKQTFSSWNTNVIIHNNIQYINKDSLKVFQS